MKSIQIGLVSLILLLFTSCSNRDDFVVFYIDNEVSKDLVVEALVDDSTTSLNEISYVDIRDSESFDKYINQLTDLNITKFEFKIENFKNDITNPQLMLDDLLINDFTTNVNGVSEITDRSLLQIIEDKFLEKRRLGLVFRGDSYTSQNFSIGVRIEMLGTFVD